MATTPDQSAASTSGPIGRYQFRPEVTVMCASGDRGPCHSQATLSYWRGPFWEGDNQGGGSKP